MERSALFFSDADFSRLWYSHADSPNSFLYCWMSLWPRDLRQSLYIRDYSPSTSGSVQLQIVLDVAPSIEHLTIPTF